MPFNPMADPETPFQESPESSEELRGLLHRFVAAERRNLPLLFWSLVVGLLAGALGGGFRLVLEFLMRQRDLLWVWASKHHDYSFWLPALFTGLMLTVSLFLVRRFAPETGGSGVQEMEGALDGLRPVRWHRVIPVKFFAGLFSLGGGLVLGREGPTIQMGGAVGAMLARLSRSSTFNRHCLIAAGAAAGLSAAFNAPLAGILFVLEEMRPQFKFNFLSFQGVMVASALSDIVVRAMTSQAPVLSTPPFPWPPLSSLWIFVVFGAIFGLFGFLFNFFLLRLLDFIGSWKGAWRAMTGILVGGGLGLLGAFIPSALGGGYEVIPAALKFGFAPAFLILLFFLRFGTTLVSYGTGAPGGIFAPMLALGTLFGIWFGENVVIFAPGLISHPGIFAVAGMGALFSATVRAPLTGIALAIEMTGNYSQILPLILTCMSASLVAQGLGGRPIYTSLLQRTLRMSVKNEEKS